jgi:NAD(P)H-hydrate epimerase
VSEASKLVTADEMRAIEAAAFAAGETPAHLMENAGRAIAEAIRVRLRDARARRVLVLVGPGNNGGDGLVIARHMHGYGAEVRVFLLAPRSEDDANLQAVRALDIDVVTPDAVEGELADAVTRADAIVDAILGIGRRRPLEGLVAAACERLASRRGRLFAVDVPTGLDADTGDVDPLTPVTDVTYALGFSKLGLHTYPGSAHAGEVEVLDIGLKAPDASLEAHAELLTDAWARERLPPRPAVSNKGSFGRVLVVAGSVSYTGAATLSCLGAIRSGAGLVTLAGLPSVRAAVGAQLPEVTYIPLPADESGAPASDAGDIVIRALSGYDALLIGPGMGQAPGAQAVVRGLLSAPQTADLPVVIDADALNSLAKVPGWPELLRPNCILTPHPGELARLAGSSVREVQASRPQTVRECAASWQQTVVLKGANTLVARPDGYMLVSPFASALLATAGTGDVLAGTIAGLLAQEVAAFEAAGLGVYLHGAAAASQEPDYGTSGLLAGELGVAIARTAARLRRGE